MKKKKLKYAAYGIGDIIDPRTKSQKMAWESTFTTPIVQDPNALPDPMKYDQSQSNRPAPSFLPDQYYTSKTDVRGTGIYDLHPAFAAVNTLALATNGIADAISNGKTSREEKLKYIQSLQNRYIENNPVLNDQPEYMAIGGDTGIATTSLPQHGQTGDTSYDTVPSYLYYLKATQAGNKQAQLLAANHIRDIRGDETSRAIQHLGNSMSQTDIHSLAKRGITTETNPQLRQLYSLINENPDIIDKFDYEMPKNKDLAFAKPKMPYGGGPLTSDGAKEILKDGKIRGKGLTDKQKKYFGFIAGGGKPHKAKYGVGDESEAVDNGQEERVEAENGEVYTNQNQNVIKIPDNYPSHEEGGVPLNDVNRVLENTSTRRKDLVSKALKITPDKFETMFGFSIKKPLSHADALEKAYDYYQKKGKKVEYGLKQGGDILERNKNDYLANNSATLNLKTAQAIPSKNHVFDLLFEHQENVKDMLGVTQDKAKYGKYVPIAAYGIDPTDDTYVDPHTGDKYASVNRRNNTKSKDWNKSKYTKAEWEQIQQKLGYNGPDDNKSFQRYLDNKFPDIVNKYHSEGPDGYGMPQVTKKKIDGFLGVRWDAIVDDLLKPKPQAPPSPDPAPIVAQPVKPDTQSIIPADPSVNPLVLKGKGKPSRFNEPLRWYDVAGPLMSLAESGRIPANYNPVELNEVKLHQQNPTPALEAGNRDYNAVLDQLPNTGAGMANATNAFSSKYSIDNQIIGQYANTNNQIQNQEELYNANVRDRQSGADQQSRAVFEQQVLGSKEAQRQQRLKSFDDLFTRVALNHKLNREGSLIMQMTPNFDQNGVYNNNQRYFTSQGTYNNDSQNGISYITDSKTGKQYPILKNNGKLENKSKILSGLNK